MATSKLDQFLENVDEKVLECTICFKRLQNPKSLNCLRSFCMVCLEDWVKAKGNLTCPTCSKSYPIPEGGLQKLPPNIFLNKLLETIEQFSEKDHMKCVCRKEGQVKYYCQDCRQYLCSTCSNYHKMFQILENHTIHLMEDVQSMSPSQMTSLHPPLCSHHSKPLEFYCRDCKTPICVNCILMDHNAWDGKHKSISISKAFQTFKETSAAFDKSAQHFIYKLEDGLKAVIQNATKLQQSKDTCLRDIDNHVEEILQKVKENSDKMKNEVEAIYKRKIIINDVQMEELETTISDIKTKLNLLHQLLKSDEGTALQSSETVITALKDRINELPKTEPDDNGQIYFLVNNQQMASLKECDIGTVTQLQVADCLTLKGQESVIQGEKFAVKIIKIEECETHLNQLKATWTHPTGKTKISQVQENENGDYFVTGKCTIPGVYKLDVSVDDGPIMQSPMIIKVKEEGLINTIKIYQADVRHVIKYEDDCLLVSCYTNEIFKYKQSGEYIDMITLPQGVQVDKMHKLKNGNIAFISDNYTTDNHTISIKICSMNGKVIRTIGEREFGSLCGMHVDETSNLLYVAGGIEERAFSYYHVHMINMNNGEVITTIGSKREQNEIRSVFDVALTKLGHLLALEFRPSKLHLFDNNKKTFIKNIVRGGDDNGKVRDPHAVIVDEDDNIIISSNHKLQLFSSDGSFIKRIDKPEDGISKPVGLSIISHHPRRIAVANNGDKTVKIFSY